MNGIQWMQMSSIMIHPPVLTWDVMWESPSWNEKVSLIKSQKWDIYRFNPRGAGMHFQSPVLGTQNE